MRTHGVSTQSSHRSWIAASPGCRQKYRSHVSGVMSVECPARHEIHDHAPRAPRRVMSERKHGAACQLWQGWRSADGGSTTCRPRRSEECQCSSQRSTACIGLLHAPQCLCQIVRAPLCAAVRAVGWTSQGDGCQSCRPRTAMWRWLDGLRLSASRRPFNMDQCGAWGGARERNVTRPGSQDQMKKHTPIPVLITKVTVNKQPKHSHTSFSKPF